MMRKGEEVVIWSEDQQEPNLAEDDVEEEPNLTEDDVVDLSQLVVSTQVQRPKEAKHPKVKEVVIYIGSL